MQTSIDLGQRVLGHVRIDSPPLVPAHPQPCRIAPRAGLPVRLAIGTVMGALLLIVGLSRVLGLVMYGPEQTRGGFSPYH